MNRGKIFRHKRPETLCTNGREFTIQLAIILPPRLGALLRIIVWEAGGASRLDGIGERVLADNPVLRASGEEKASHTIARLNTNLEVARHPPKMRKPVSIIFSPATMSRTNSACGSRRAPCRH